MKKEGQPVNPLEAQTEDSSLMVARIRVMSRNLLYNPPQDPLQEAKSYMYIKSFTDSDHSGIVNAAKDALRKRWAKIGFYKKRYSSYALDRDQAKEYDGEGWIREGSQVGILKLAAAEKPLTARQFENKMISVFGPYIKPSEVLADLTNLYVLTPDADYAELIEKNRGRFKLNPDALRVLSPHLVVLNALFYPEIIPERDVEKLRQLKESSKSAANKILQRLKDKNLLTLALKYSNEEKGSIIMIEKIQDEIEGRKRGESSFWENRKRLAFMDSDNNLAQLIIDPGGISAELELSIYNQPDYAYNHLTRDFSGRLITGDEVASVSLSGEHAYLTARGSFKPELPLDLDKAEQVYLSDSGMGFTWKIQDGDGKTIYVSVYFCRDYKDTYLESHRTTYYISDRPTYTYIRFKRSEDEEGSPFQEEETKVVLDNNSGEALITHPKGERCTISYAFDKKILTINVKKGDWTQSFTVPRRLDPTKIARAIVRKIEGLIANIEANQTLIESQLQDVCELSLAQEIGIKESKAKDGLSFYTQEFRRLPQERRFSHLEQIDEALENLDPKSKMAVKSYINLLLGEEKPSSEEDRPEIYWIDPLGEDKVSGSKRKIRMLISQAKLSVPDSLLNLIEQAFLG